MDEDFKKTKDPQRFRYADKTCEDEAPRKEGFKKQMRSLRVETKIYRKAYTEKAPQVGGFKKHEQRTYEGYESTCNQCGNEVSSKRKLKTRIFITRGKDQIYCDQCDKKFTLKHDPKEP